MGQQDFSESFERRFRECRSIADRFDDVIVDFHVRKTLANLLPIPARA
jgi:hypothetical protein